MSDSGESARSKLKALVLRIPPPARKVFFEARKHVDVPVILPLGDGLLWVAQAGTFDFEILTWEVEEREAVARIVHPGEVAIDVGAHCGLYTILLSRLVGPQGRVLAFEPSPRELPRLERHLRINDCANAKLEPIAVGNSSGTVTLYLSGGRRTTGTNSLRPASGRTWNVNVPLQRIDDYVALHPEYARPDFIKMDIEGAELEALRGARDTIERSHPTILIEMAEAQCVPWGYRCVEKYDLLAEWGYRLCGLSLETFPRIENYDPLVNLVAIHPSRG